MKNQDANVAGASTDSREQSVTTVSPRMDERALEALKGSIEKWRAIEAGTVADKGTINCPLCALFIDDDCVACPVRVRDARNAYCSNEEYRAWSARMRVLDRCEYDGTRRADTPELVALARAEREFLESLLPRALQDEPALSFHRDQI